MDWSMGRNRIPENSGFRSGLLTHDASVPAPPGDAAECHPV
jgi:hypothetical protein